MVKLMGIINVTPDSFSDGGDHIKPESALKRAHELISQGCHILDLGAESSRPDSQKITAEVEISRLEPVLDLFQKEKINEKVIISLDTQKSAVAKMGLNYGIKMVNDISALTNDAEIGTLVANEDLKLVIMYKQNPYPNPETKHYTNIINDISSFLEERIKFCESLGITKEKIIIDPGMGSFLSNDGNYSFTVLKELPKLKKLHPEILIGISRKGFIGGSIKDRDIPSLILDFLAIQNGATIIRTHNPIHHQHLLNIHAQIISN